MKHSIPKLRAFTACLWLRPAGGGIGTPLSYAVPEQPNELVLLQGLHTPAELLVNDKVMCESAAVGQPLMRNVKKPKIGLCTSTQFSWLQKDESKGQLELLQKYGKLYFHRMITRSRLKKKKKSICTDHHVKMSNFRPLFRKPGSGVSVCSDHFMQNGEIISYFTGSILNYLFINVNLNLVFFYLQNPSWDL